MPVKATATAGMKFEPGAGIENACNYLFLLAKIWKISYPTHITTHIPKDFIHSIDRLGEPPNRCDLIGVSRHLTGSVNGPNSMPS
jgi:hypothetical protein